MVGQSARPVFGCMRQHDHLLEVLGERDGEGEFHRDGLLGQHGERRRKVMKALRKVIDVDNRQAVVSTEW